MSAEALRALNTHTWVTFFSGNQAMGLNKPGVVLVCGAEPSERAGSDRYTPLDCVNAKNDAAAVAQALLKQRWDCKGGVYARILVIDDATLRTQITAHIVEICTQHKD